VISRVTLVSFLLALLLTAGIYLWSAEHWDDCARYMAGDTSLPSSEVVDVGDPQVEVQCGQWLPRQPVALQVMCLVDLVAVIVFTLNAVGNFLEWKQARRNVGL
jgi:hypothetical protein